LRRRSRLKKLNNAALIFAEGFMKKLITLLALILSMALCASAASLNPRELVSSDGKSKLELPEGWNPATDLKKGAEFQARSDQGFFIGLVDSKEDLADPSLEHFTKGRVDHVLSSIQNGQATELKKTTLNGRPAFTSVVKGIVGELRITYLLTCVETSDSLIQLMGWSTNSKFEKVKPEIEAIVQSFKEKKTA